jgi:hypothetical protein
MNPDDLIPQTFSRSRGNAKSRPVARWQAFLAERLAPVLLEMPDAALIPEVVLPHVTKRPMASHWIPLGPFVVRRGESLMTAPMSGRVPGLAVAIDGQRVYAATANGGVWRSDDAGKNWRPLMDKLVVRPHFPGGDSLACGAIAIDLTNPDRIYVGSGEGAEGMYVGVGPLVSDNGGEDWRREPSDPELGGKAFYALAVDPGDPSHVVAATTQGIYERQLESGNNYRWVQTRAWAVPVPPPQENDEDRYNRERSDRATSVVVARRDNVTTFFAAHFGEAVYSSTDGKIWDYLGNWPQLGTHFPDQVSCITLGVQPDNPKVVYALAAGRNQKLHGLYRYEKGDETWWKVEGVPKDLFGGDTAKIGQGWYDLAIAVAPDNANRVYVGGAAVAINNTYSGALYRLEIEVARSGNQITEVRAICAFLGESVHADIHTLVFVPGDAKRLWVGCDGGVFYGDDVTRARSVFQPRNTGLATLMMLSLGQHPTEDAVLFGGTQDNGCLRFTAEEAWLYSAPGDSGSVIVNWHNPYRIFSTYTLDAYRVSSVGGRPGSFVDKRVGLSEGDAPDFYPPFASTPFNPGNPTEANLVAFGSTRVWLSSDFGDQTWWSIPNNNLADDQLNGTIKALVFADGRKLYAGTWNGGVYRFKHGNERWQKEALHLDANQAPILPLAGIVTSLVVDPADTTGDSVYLTFGGDGDVPRVWHFDGKKWQPRSGSGAVEQSLPNVHFNAIVADPDDPARLYAAADIGVWASTDCGTTWTAFSNGLPESAVVDLQLFRSTDPARPLRLLRAATHGRGVFECSLTDEPDPVRLFIRHTILDTGRFPTIFGLDNPTEPGRRVDHTISPDIRIDWADNGAFQFPDTDPDFLEFVDVLQDDSANVPYAEHRGLRIYVQVHNRGQAVAEQVAVMLLRTNSTGNWRTLPQNLQANVQTGTPINTADWQTVGNVILAGVRVGLPKIARFDMSLDVLPKPHANASNTYYFLAVVHHARDPFENQLSDSWALGRVNRKAAIKSFTIVGP